MPRDRAYWVEKLARAREALEVASRTKATLAVHPSANKALKKGTWEYRDALQLWEYQQRRIRRDRKRYSRLVHTQIPYYEAQIEARTPTALDRLLGEPFV